MNLRGVVFPKQALQLRACGGVFSGTHEREPEITRVLIIIRIEFLRALKIRDRVPRFAFGNEHPAKPLIRRKVRRITLDLRAEGFIIVAWRLRYATSCGKRRHVFLDCFPIARKWP